MEMEEIFIETRPDIAYIKFIFESYEEVGIIRTVDRRKAIIVLLATPDFAGVAREILRSLMREVPLKEIERPADVSADWLMTELAAESGERSS
jgi:hypothetical protein